MKVFIVDDEKRGVTVLKNLLENYFPQLLVVGVANNVQDAIIKINESKPDLLLLDISMPDKSGFDLLMEITPITFEVIFITAHSEYAIKAFSYSAVDYLLKPVDEDLFIKAVEKAINRFTQKENPSNIETLLQNIKLGTNQQSLKLCVSSLKGFQVIALADILYLAAENCYTIFHLVNGNKITASKTIAEFEEMLEAASFFRIHKSFMININYLEEYIRGDGGSVIMHGGIEVEVSRRRKEAFVNRIKTIFKL